MIFLHERCLMLNFVGIAQKEVLALLPRGRQNSLSFGVPRPQQSCGLGGPWINNPRAPRGAGKHLLKFLLGILIKRINLVLVGNHLVGRNVASGRLDDFR